LNSSNSNTPLIVEFIGVTGAGKSTLLAAVAELLSKQGMRVREAEDVILARWGLSLSGHAKSRSAIVLLMALAPFARFLCTRNGCRLSWLASRAIVRGMGNCWIGAKLFAHFVRRIGSHLLLERMRSELVDCDIVLCDEGVVHAAHNLFVHAGVVPESREVERFGAMVPRPDVLVWVTAPAERSAAVILQRGHSRVHAEPAAALEFAAHAQATFEVLSNVEELQEMIFRIDNTRDGDRAVAITERAVAVGAFLEHQLHERSQTPAAADVLNSLSLHSVSTP
jgi:thymidylate kinase